MWQWLSSLFKKRKHIDLLYIRNTDQIVYKRKGVVATDSSGYKPLVHRLGYQGVFNTRDIDTPPHESIRAFTWYIYDTFYESRKLTRIYYISAQDLTRLIKKRFGLNVLKELADRFPPAYTNGIGYTSTVDLEVNRVFFEILDQYEFYIRREEQL